MSGPLEGITIIEIAGLGPAPFAGMMLADHGAEVIRIERPGGTQKNQLDTDVLARSRRIIEVDLKAPSGTEVVRALIRKADGLIEGFRPGVMERLSLGPSALLEINPKLVYGRMTGWGQDGPYVNMAGHDINYIALSGALYSLGRAGDKPTPPLNLVGDFGGGGMLLAFGMVSALLNAQTTGVGQVVDCAMVDGSGLLMSMMWSEIARNQWQMERGKNIIDSGAHFYDSYETADGHYITIGAVEPQFYQQLLQLTGLDKDASFDQQMNTSKWPELKDRLEDVFKSKTRDEWCHILEYSDACFSPVLSMKEAPLHPHNQQRNNFITVNNVTQPAPAPKYSKTPTRCPTMPGSSAESPEELLQTFGYSDKQVAQLINSGVINA